MRSIRILVALVTIALPLRAQAVVADSPEVVAQQYVVALRANDWKGMAALMHPEALSKFRSMLRLALHSEQGRTLREQFFGGITARQLDSLTDVEFYARFLAAAMSSEPDLRTFMDSAQVKVVGHVAETPDIVHVVFVMRLRMGPVSVSKPDVLSFKRQGNVWRALLRADMEIMAAALEQRFRS